VIQYFTRQVVIQYKETQNLYFCEIYSIRNFKIYNKIAVDEYSDFFPTKLLLENIADLLYQTLCERMNS
jgi:hypothetical protein